MDAERVRVLERISTVVTDHRQYHDRLPLELATALSIPYHGHVHNAISSSLHDETTATTSTAVAMTKQEIVLLKTIVNHAMNTLNKWSIFFQNAETSHKSTIKSEQKPGDKSNVSVAAGVANVSSATSTTVAKQGSTALSVTTTSTSTRSAHSLKTVSSTVTTTKTTVTSNSRSRQATQAPTKLARGSSRGASKRGPAPEPASIYNTSDPTYDHILILVDLGFIALKALERLDLDANKGFLEVLKARSNLVTKIISLAMKKRGMQELSVFRTQLLKAAVLLWPEDKLAERQPPAPIKTYLSPLLQQPGMPATWCSLLTMLNPKVSFGPLDAMLRLHFQAAEKISDVEHYVFDIQMLGVRYSALQALVPGGRGQDAMWKTMLSCGKQLQTKAPAEQAIATADRILDRFKRLLESVVSTVTPNTQLLAFKHWRQYLDTLSSKASHSRLADEITVMVDPSKQESETRRTESTQSPKSHQSTPSPTTPEALGTSGLDIAGALRDVVGSARKLESVCNGRLKGDLSVVELDSACHDSLAALTTLERIVGSTSYADQQSLDLKALQNVARIFQANDCIWSLASKCFDKASVQNSQVTSTVDGGEDVEKTEEISSPDANMPFVYTVKPVLELMSRIASPLWRHCQAAYMALQPQHQRLLPLPFKLASACVDSLLFLFRLSSISPIDDDELQPANQYLDAARTIATEMGDWESLRWISNALYNHGGSLFKFGLHRDAALQILSCIECFLAWIRSDAAADMTEQARAEARVTLAKRYEVLAICHSAQNNHKDALDALDSGLCALPLEEYQKLHSHLISGYTNHAQLPIAAQLLDRRTRTLLLDLVRFDSFTNSMAVGELSPPPSLDVIGLIQEFESSVLQLLSVKADCRQICIQHLRSIADKTYRGGSHIQFPIRRARVLIALASLLQSSTAENMRSQSASLASEAVETLKTKSLASDVDLHSFQSHYLAFAYTWLGILQPNLDGSAQKSKPFQIALQLWESILADVECFTTVADAATEASRLKAQAASSMIADTEQLVCHLQLLADYLGMIGQQVMQVHVYMLILKMTNSVVNSDPQSCCCYSGKAKIALDQGKEILEELKRDSGDGSQSNGGLYGGYGELYANWLLAYSLYMSTLGHKKQGIQAYNEAAMYSASQDSIQHNLNPRSHAGLAPAGRRPRDPALSKSTEMKIRKTVILAEASLARSYLQYNEGNLSEAIPDAMRSLRQLSTIVTTLVKASERPSTSGSVKREPENPFMRKSSSTMYQPQGLGVATKPSNQQGSNSQLQKELEVLAHQRHQWQVFRLLIETFHHLARLYLSQGCAREAEYFLQEGKAVAKLSRASRHVDRLLLKQAAFSLRKHEWEETHGILNSLTQRDDHTSLALDLRDACVQLCFGDLYHQTGNLERSLRAYVRTDEILTHLMDKEFIAKLERMVIKEPQTPREKKLTHQVRTRSQKGSLLPQKSASQYECMTMSRMKARCGYRKALVQGETLQRAEAARTIEDACQVHPMADKSIEYHHVKAKVLMMELQGLMSKHIILAMVPESVLGVGLVRRLVSATSPPLSIPSSSAVATSQAITLSNPTSRSGRVTRSARGSSRSHNNAAPDRQEGYIQVLQQAKWHLDEAYRLAVKGSPPHIVSDICTRQAFLSLMESCLHQDLFKVTNPMLLGGVGSDSLSPLSAFISPSRPTNVSTKEAIDRHYRRLASRTSFFLELSKGITQRRELYNMVRGKLHPTLPQEDFAWPSAIKPPLVQQARLEEGTQADENDDMQLDVEEASIHVPGTRSKFLLQAMSTSSAFASTSNQMAYLRALEQVYGKEQDLHISHQPITSSANPFVTCQSNTPSVPAPSSRASLTGKPVGDAEPSDQFLSDFVDILPSSWTVVSLSMDIERETLYVNRLRAHTMPVILQLPLTRVKQRAADHPEPLTYDLALAELEDILKNSNETLQAGQSLVTREEKLAWWEARKELDDRMHNLLQVMQNHWLCGLQGVIQSHNTPRNEEHLEQFKASMERLMFLAAHSRPLPSTLASLGNSVGGFGVGDGWSPEAPTTRTMRRPVRSTATTSKLMAMSKDNLQQQQQQQEKTLFLEIDKEICRMILNLGDQPANDELEDVIYFLLDAYQHHGAVFEFAEIDFSRMAALIQQALVAYWLAETDLGNDGFDNGAHVILILDKHLQMFPWENLPVLRGEAVSRLPSIWFLRDRILRSQGVAEQHVATATAATGAAESPSTLPLEMEYQDTQEGRQIKPVNAWRDLEVDPSSAYYILNPGGDLAHTEQTFRDYVETQRGWDGVIGRRPLDLECVQGLSQSELYIYFGHSGGEQYIKSHQIRQLLPTRCSVSLLLGCSSGVLTSKGEFDPYGNVLNYILAGCPTVVANLWDVTDKDIDRFSKAMFTAWGLDNNRTTTTTTTTATTISAEEPQQQQRLSIVEAVKVARGECRMPYLVGAAPVVYGIPCFLKQ
ncbi:hypothetical protein DFQ27_004497 [Actinomortierella ambigua]|uniref:separase n=1 Tax=Actinomortierella ambigua TaxID=1343610 RepID=A0A9P6Q569_9FUNG|nr:hypothetical protein DFQ27_004497 [Actinomortierella ambigua]